MIEFNDEDVISLLQYNNTLRDAEVTLLFIKTEFAVPYIELEFEMRHGSDFLRIAIYFSKLKRFDFDFVEGSAFLEVWDYKLLLLEDRVFYLSLNPDPDSLPSAGCVKTEPSDHDRFVIVSQHIKVRILAP